MVVGVVAEDSSEDGTASVDVRARGLAAQPAPTSKIHPPTKRDVKNARILTERSGKRKLALQVLPLLKFEFSLRKPT